MSLFFADLFHQVFHDRLLVLDVLYLDSMHFGLVVFFSLCWRVPIGLRLGGGELKVRLRVLATD